MQDPNELESYYEEVVEDLSHHLPDGINEVNLTLMQDLGLLEEQEPTGTNDDLLSQSFCVVETDEKLTLFNDTFVIWIVPEIESDNPSTLTLIALNHEEELPRLETGFITTGIYNHSSLVLRILEKFLEQIEENEKELVKLKIE